MWRRRGQEEISLLKSKSEPEPEIKIGYDSDSSKILKDLQLQQIIFLSSSSGLTLANNFSGLRLALRLQQTISPGSDFGSSEKCLQK